MHHPSLKTTSRLLLAGCALLSIVALHCDPQDTTMPGTPIGAFSVSAVMSGTNTCGSLGAANPWTFNADLSQDGQTLYWRQADTTISGALDANKQATLLGYQGMTIREPAPGSSGCSMSRSDSIQVTLGDTSATISGTITFAFAVGSATDCYDQLTINGGSYDTLPCQATFTFTGTRTGDVLLAHESAQLFGRCVSALQRDPTLTLSTCFMQTRSVRQSAPRPRIAHLQTLLVMGAALFLTRCTLDTEGALTEDEPFAGAGGSGGSAQAGSGGAGNGGLGGSSGAGNGGLAGSEGLGGTYGTEGPGGSANNGGTAGSGGSGTAGTAGTGGDTSEGGTAGEAGNGGDAGNGGEAGEAGNAGSSAGGASGTAGESGNSGSGGSDAGSSGAGGSGGSDAGAAGSGGTAGEAGVGGSAGSDGGAAGNAGAAGSGGSDAGAAGSGGSDAGSGGTGGSGGSGGVVSVCGDGIVNGDEQCDPGNELNELCVQCKAVCPIPTGGTAVLSEDGLSHCYAMSANNAKKKWSEARSACKNLGASCELVSINSADELSFLKSKLTFSGRVWSGGQARQSFSENSSRPAFTWSNGDFFTIGPTERWMKAAAGNDGPQRPPWASGEPNNKNGGLCAQFYEAAEHTLDDTDCNNEGNYLCECTTPGAVCNGNGVLDPGEECDDGNFEDGDGCSAKCKIECDAPSSDFTPFSSPIDGHCYLVSKATKSWEDAYTSCSKLDGNFTLARITSTAEFNSVSSQLPTSVNVWVDGSDAASQGSFIFGDSSPVPFAKDIYPWRPGEPNNSNNNEHCIQITNFTGSSPKGRFFNDSVCTDPQRFVCERVVAGASGP